MQLKTLYFNSGWLLQSRFLRSMLRKLLTVDVSALGKLMVLSFLRAVSHLIMRVNKPKISQKLALQPYPRNSLDLLLSKHKTILKKKLKRINWNTRLIITRNKIRHVSFKETSLFALFGYFGLRLAKLACLGENNRRSENNRNVVVVEVEGNNRNVVVVVEWKKCSGGRI